MSVILLIREDSINRPITIIITSRFALTAWCIMKTINLLSKLNYIKSPNYACNLSARYYCAIRQRRKPIDNVSHSCNIVMASVH